MNMFQVLNAEEEKEFRKWARDNYVKYDPINELWYPVVRKECQRINEEETE